MRMLSAFIVIVTMATAPLYADTSASAPRYPDVADTRHATKKAVDLIDSFFRAKSSHDVDRTMAHFSEENITYIDATVGSPFYTYDILKGIFAKFMPTWPDHALSYPTKILGNEHSVLVEFTDTPELFGGEARAFAAVDFEDGKIVRWIDYWDSRNFGVVEASKQRRPTYPSDFKDGRDKAKASGRILEVATRLHDALTAGDSAAAAMLFSEDATYEDMALRTQIRGRAAISRYLKRASDHIPAGKSSALLHIVGGDLGGGYEWQASPAYSSTVRRGITSIALDKDGKISSLTSLWDGGLISDSKIKSLAALSID